MKSLKVGLFPGQGVAADLVRDALPKGHPLVDQANDFLGFDLVRRVAVSCERPHAVLPTSLAQVATFVAGVVAVTTAFDAGTRFDALIGHSVGELAALVAGEGLSYRDGLRVVEVRGRATQAAAAARPGRMAAVRGVDQETVLAVAERAAVTLANDNAPGQLVLAGPNEDLGRAAELLVAEGARVVLLDVAGAFHSPAMAPAARSLRDILDHVNVRNPIVPVISNVTARPYRAPGEIRRLLVEQLTGRVRLRESLEWVWQRGVREPVDLGPGRVVERLALKTFAHLDRLEPALNA